MGRKMGGKNTLVKKNMRYTAAGLPDNRTVTNDNLSLHISLTEQALKGQTKIARRFCTSHEKTPTGGQYTRIKVFEETTDTFGQTSIIDFAR